MAPSSKLPTLVAMTLLAIALAACSGAAAGGPGRTPEPSPVVIPATPVPPTPVPAAPTPAAPAPTEAPADPTPMPVEPDNGIGGGDAMPIKVDLDNATGDDVYVDIVDRSGRIVRAASGTPGDGASVAPYEVKVENVDDRTIRLTWSDIPGDNALALYVDEAGSGLVLVQPEHDGDSIAFDRVLVLGFDGPTAAGDLRVTIQDGLDTPG